MHAELYHAGWIQSGTRRWHYFAPGISTSECGLMRAEDWMPRKPEIGSQGCANCRKVMARLSMKLRDAETFAGEWTEKKEG